MTEKKLTKKQKEFIRLFKLAARIVMIEDKQLLQELAKK